MLHHIALLQSINLWITTLVALCYAYQLFYLVIPFLRRQKAHAPARQHRYAILIAARNEEKVLPFLLDSIAQQDYPREDVAVYVIADNCTDGTAACARAKGARVFERFNTRQVGKGYALHDLLACIEAEGGLTRYDAFLVFDADNLLESDYITQINRTFSDGYNVVCGYRNSKNFGSNWVSAGHAVWYLHDSAHMNQSRMLLGTSCGVSGTGFGFTRETLERCGGWNFFTLTEDFEFNTYCATHGIKIGYCPDAMLYDEQPTSFRQSWRQRTRWTHGGLQIAGRYSRDMLRGIFRLDGSSYACFELFTLSFWGYGTSALVMGFSSLITLLTLRGAGIPLMLLSSAASGYLSMLMVGLLTVLPQWRRIRATPWQKIGDAFAFPLFIITSIPITITALFRKFQWLPIEHKVAVPVSKLQK